MTVTSREEKGTGSGVLFVSRFIENKLLRTMYPSSMTNKGRINIKPGLRVSIILRKDQRSRILTEGIVKDILTKSPTHPHGIKVRLEDGQVGRVKEIIILSLAVVGFDVVFDVDVPPHLVSILPLFIFVI